MSRLFHSNDFERLPSARTEELEGRRRRVHVHVVLIPARKHAVPQVVRVQLVVRKVGRRGCRPFEAFRIRLPPFIVRRAAHEHHALERTQREAMPLAMVAPGVLHVLWMLVLKGGQVCRGPKVEDLTALAHRIRDIEFRVFACAPEETLAHIVDDLAAGRVWNAPHGS